MDTTRDIEERGVATAEFERDLEALVLAAYACGAAIEGIWTVQPKPGPVPDWTIEITKGDDATDRDAFAGD